MILRCPHDGTELRVLATWFTIEVDGMLEHVAARCTAAPVTHPFTDTLHALEAASER